MSSLTQSLPGGRLRPHLDRLFTPCDAAGLAVFRIAFGLIVAWEALRYFPGDRVRRLFIEPTFHFTYFGFDWVRPWPGNGMYLHMAVLLLAGLAVSAGAAYRLASVVLAVCLVHLFLIDQAYYLNHIYLVCLVGAIMACVPANAGWSMDAAGRRGAAGTGATVPSWTVWLLRAQVGIVYLFGGLAKMNADWLRADPLRDWLLQVRGMPWLGPVFGHPFTPWVFAYGGLLFDLLIVPALLWKRTRAAAFAIAVLFHLTNALVFRIGIFPWFMIAATTLCFEPDWPKRFRSRVARGKTGHAPRRPDAAAPRRGVVWALALYLGLQILFPLRHWLYPGDVNWTEEGHRFAWRMKLRAKDGSVQYFVTDPATGQTATVDPRMTLTPNQFAEMSTRPDMILQYAHHLASEARAKTGRTVEVRAAASVSLNGRTPQLLIDPRVDLAAQRRSLGRADWIQPLTQPR